MKPLRADSLEGKLITAARSMRYPRTPDVSTAVSATITSSRSMQPRTFFRAAVVVALLLALVLAAAPQAGALVRGWFRIGVIRIAPAEPGPAVGSSQAPVTSTPLITPTGAALPRSLQGLSGLTTLDAAIKLSGGHLRLPHHPSDLADPDFVIWQPEFDMLAFVWQDPADHTRTYLALFEFLSDQPILNKVEPTILQETSVHSSPALWLEGPYPLMVTGEGIQWKRIVSGRSLVWESGGITYRIETLLSLDEARRIAESIPTDNP